MTSFRDDPDFLFHSCALAAWMTVAAETGQNPPDSDLVKAKTYALYEAELRQKADVGRT